jgi:tRNA pseudouridine synthase 10
MLAGGPPSPDVLDDVAALLETGPLCDHCLGRPFADRSFGLTNGERGRALRTTLALERDADFEAFDPETSVCWVCENHCQRFETWTDRVIERVSAVEFATYQVGTRTPPLIEENERLLRDSAGLAVDAGEPFNREMNREVGRRVGQRTERDVDLERPDVTVVLELADDSVEMQINPAFVYGRYRKLEREIPQTEWPCRTCGGSGTRIEGDAAVDCRDCDGAGYRYPTSVEEEVAPPVVAAMNGTEGVFHGAGREDVDARMLGTGRPFVLEVKRPQRRRPAVDDLEASINEGAEGRVAVTGLRLATHEMVERVKELDAAKTYRATVRFEDSVAAAALAGALEELEGATLEQYTPERVDHRRAGKTRERTVYWIDGALGRTDGAPEPSESPARATEATVECRCEAGLYVKELVSGDEGRTEPSLAGLLGVGATVTALDVTAVEGEDEAFENEEFFIE